jgi:glycerol-3-phosphate dehydrogenase (NAD(P)+)
MGTPSGPPIGVLGAGSWGTALAMQFARSGRPVLLWGRPEDGMTAMQAARENARYLPGCRFPDSLTATDDLAALLDATRDLMVVIPSHGLRGLLAQLSHAPHAHRIAWATKGFETGTGLLPHEVAEQTVGKARSLAVLSGPTFAREVGRDLPTACVIAANDRSFAEDLATALHHGRLRAYTSDDLVGVEVGGAVKNVIAIAAGISDGLGFGANARAALITRGLAEIMRLGSALGARPETLMGLAGMGDLVLTCTDDQSRNRRTGLLLAAGKSLDEAREEIGQVVEGAWAARDVKTRADALHIEMPITEQVYQVLYEGVAPRDAMRNLLDRARKKE